MGQFEKLPNLTQQSISGLRVVRILHIHLYKGFALQVCDSLAKSVIGKVNLAAVLEPINDFQNLRERLAKGLGLELEEVFHFTGKNEQPDFKWLGRVNEYSVDISLHLFELCERGLKVLVEIRVALMFHV